MQIPSLVFIYMFTSASMLAVDAARILVLIPYNARSHFIVMEPLLLALHSRGHHLTVVSSFPRQPPLQNYTDIDLSSKLPPMISNYSLESIQESMPNIFKTAIFITKIHMDVCNEIMKDDQVLNLLNHQFDLMVGEIFGSDCFNYIAHKLNVPIVSWVTSTMLPWATGRTGLPDNPSYISNYFVDYDSRMTFYQRLFNTVTLFYVKGVYFFYSMLPSQKLAEKTFKENLPSMFEINQKTSLVLVNSHYSYSQSRPFPPNVVEVGGIHIKETKPLPKDLKEILDSAKDGVILFSFGSLVRVASLPRETILMFMSVFATMPQKVIFKYEEELPDAPSNVIIRKWLPQSDIIAHPNVRAVVTHGGLASTIEAVHFAKPLVGVPFFSDQYQNVKNIVRRGAGVMLDVKNLSQRDIFDAFHKVLENRRYKEKMMLLSQRYHDRPMTALQSAVYWTEYVIRHQGAPHLQPASVSLPLYQYLLLDVIALLLTILAATIYLVLVTVRFLRFIFFCDKKVTSAKLKTVPKKRTKTD